MTLCSFAYIGPLQKTFAKRYFSMAKVDSLGIVVTVDMVDNMAMADNVKIVDSIDMLNMQKTSAYL